MLIQVAPGQSLQTVIDALPADDHPVTIQLAPGVYEEKIALRRPHTRIEVQISGKRYLVCGSPKLGSGCTGQ